MTERSLQIVEMALARYRRFGDAMLGIGNGLQVVVKVFHPVTGQSCDFLVPINRARVLIDNQTADEESQRDLLREALYQAEAGAVSSAG